MPAFTDLFYKNIMELRRKSTYNQEIHDINI